MKIDLKNNLGKDILIGAVADLSMTFKFKPLKKNTIGSFTDKDKYVAFCVPKGQGLKISCNTNMIFRFIQTQPEDPNNDGMDTYVFQVTSFQMDKDSEKVMDHHDADIDPPDPGIPLG